LEGQVVAYALELMLSLVVLAIAGDQFVVGAGRLARELNLRPAVVGAVVGGLGASAPELIVSGVASLRGSPLIAVGNLVGSIIANVSLALAVAALLSPVRVESRTVRREAPLSVGGVLLFAVLLPGGLTTIKGFVLLVALALALAVLVANARLGTPGDELDVEVRRFFHAGKGHRRPLEATRAVIGLALMLVGAEVLVRSSSGLAEKLGLAQGFIGLTVVAAGTTAPLVAIAIQAARRGNHDLVVGAVLGSNLFIALAGGTIVGLLHGASASAVGPAPVVAMVVIALAAWGLMARGNVLNRWEAAVLIVAYVAALPFAAH
jgi:cation:H+ antiporter